MTKKENNIDKIQPYKPWEINISTDMFDTIFVEKETQKEVKKIELLVSDESQKKETNIKDIFIKINKILHENKIVFWLWILMFSIIFLWFIIEIFINLSK